MAEVAVEVAVAYAFMAKKMASMQRVLSPLEGGDEGLDDSVAFEPFEFDGQHSKVRQSMFLFVVITALRKGLLMFVGMRCMPMFVGGASGGDC